jgi:hypothetical protein
VDNFFNALFPKSSITKLMVNTKGHLNENNDDDISFQELGVTEKDIINKLMEFNLLPINFYSL